MRIEVLLQRIEARQREVAQQAVEQPDGDRFAYGRACGIYAGLGLARQTILDALADENERDL